MIYPLKQYVVTQKFGETVTDAKGHTGLDLYQPVGTPIYAAEGGDILCAGVISNSYGNEDYGNCVLIDHHDGLYTFYAHMNTVDVKTGMSVIQGAQIGTVGTTGNVTGPHLHFEVRTNPTWNRANFVDPEPYLTSSSGAATSPTYIDNQPSIFDDKQEVKIVGSSVNMRAAPGLSAEIVGVLGLGTKMVVSGESKVADGLTWYPVTMTGYVASSNGELPLLGAV